MKTMWMAVVLCGLACAGCSEEPDFHRYVGTGAVMPAGSGGTMQVVRGMEVWDGCKPPRRYLVMGTMVSEGGRFSDSDYELKEVVKAAKRQGADALILTDEDEGGWGMRGGEADGGFRASFGNFRPEAGAILIKYL